MKNSAIALLCIMLLTIVGCNKFEHEELTIPDCDLCNYASTLNGSYRGLSEGNAVPNMSDSVTIMFEQIFIGNSQYEDSTFIYFEVVYDFDTSVGTSVDTIQLMNSSGNCFTRMTNVFSLVLSYPFKYKPVFYQLNVDSLSIESTYYPISGGIIGADLLYFGGDFDRQ